MYVYVCMYVGVAEEVPVVMHLILAMFETKRVIDEPMEVCV